MKIKFTQTVRSGETVYLPGTVVDVKEKEAKAHIKQDVAIALEEVADDSGPNSTEV